MKAEKKPIRLSVVAPVYNEAESLEALHKEITAVLEKGFYGIPFDGEILFVDDGSTDGSDRIAEGLHPMRLIRMGKHSGQSAAMNRGFHEAKGDFIAALDADGQNVPADIPVLLKYLLDNDLDMICGWRKNRRDPFGKRMASWGAWALRQAFLHDGVHDSGCTLKVFRAECIQSLVLKDGDHRFIPALAKHRGWKIGECPVRHRARAHGESKYGPGRMIHGLRGIRRIRGSRQLQEVMKKDNRQTEGTTR